ncbi:hypothetical protein MC885_001603 [Smutsia gigantea]|nr:hypothetical protein MC885_001603 [Smutsia gigantea]
MVPAFSMVTSLNMDAFPWRAILQLQPFFLQEAPVLGSFGLSEGSQRCRGRRETDLTFEDAEWHQS